MSQIPPIGRRAFLLHSAQGAAAFLAASFLHLLGCGQKTTLNSLSNAQSASQLSGPPSGMPQPQPSSSPLPSGPPSCSANGTQASIGLNHGHVLMVPSADVAAGVSKTYNIQGTSGHNHTVTISAAQFSQLASNLGLAVLSSFDGGHDHTITIVCM